MYKHLFLLAIVAIGLNACGPVYVVQQTPPPPAPAPAPPPAAPEDASYQTFYDQLSPYGQWIQDPDYGYVWMPEVTPDFKPYATNGHWVYTDEGWAWDSGYPWGWAAFHYGRWFFRDGYGWMWIPGNEWAPAWVSWRNSDDYYGWAPMEPGVSVSVAYSSGYNPPPHYWCFVPHQYVASPQINNYYVRETNNVTIINRTTVINNVTVINNNNTTIINNHYGNNHYGAGPDPNEVSRFTGAPLRPTPIRESRAPGGGGVNGGSFAVYRPHVNSAPPAGDSHAGGNGRPGGYAPTNFHPLNMARPVNRTNYGANPTPPPAQNMPGAGNENRGNGYENRGNGYENRGNGNDNRGNGNDNRGNGNDNRGNGFENRGNGYENRGNNNDNRGNNNGNRGYGQPSGAQPVNGQPANNPRIYNRPPAGQPPANQGQPSAQPAGHPSAPQPTPATRQPQPRPQRPFGPPNQNAGQPRPAVGQPNQNTNHPRPIGNRPKPAPVQHNPPPPQKRDDGQNHQ
ncbi:MAG TPA: DUF6600 domain-containing protein [Puia sp.]|nr:DUF6600 domain-containing protein [Puia sp.]